MERSLPPNKRETADSRDSVARTTWVFCFLPTSSQPEDESALPLMPAAPGETGRSTSRLDESLG